MQNLDTLNTKDNTKELNLQLFHLQTNIAFDLPSNISVICIGKHNEKDTPDIDVSNLPNNDIVSRIHAKIQIEENNYFIEDLGSSNGTFINNTRLMLDTLYKLKLGDKIDLGQGNKVTFIFQDKQNPVNLESESKTQLSQKEDITSRVGLFTMLTAIVIINTSIQIGIFVQIPTILLLITGFAILIWGFLNRNLGWILIVLGITIMLLTRAVFASVNIAAICVSIALFIAGYQLYNTGIIWKYDLRSHDVSQNTESAFLPQPSEGEFPKSRLGKSLKALLQK
jgi:pSer/pThr/pTyr-binding forkhead associated (FHA) protein